MKLLRLEEMDQQRLDHFRSFYEVLIELRDQVSNAPPEGPGRPLELGFQDLQVRLREKLLELGYTTGEPSGDDDVDPGYVMVAMADEVMLMDCGKWRDHAAWTERPLEREVYGTRLAGDRVFDTARKLVAGPQDKSGTAVLILACLLLGYRGRYRRDAGGVAPEITKLRDELYAHVYGGAWSPADAELVDTADGPRGGSSVRRVPALWPWIVATLIVALAYLPVSHVLWRSQVHGVAKLADAILKGVPAPPPGPERKR
jgi:type IV/VI secretion system ImpK/VasF family protein